VDTTPIADAAGFCDLHAHSTASDGTDTPTQLAEHASAVGLKALALTDHDTTRGQAECAAACQRLGVEFVPGIEVSADVHAITAPPANARPILHILGLFIRPDDPTLRALCDRQLALRNEHAPRILDELAKLGMPVTIEEVTAFSGGEVIGRMHIANAMIARGYVGSMAEAKKYLGRHGPIQPRREFVPPADAIGAIHAAGGLAILAHPVRLECPSKDDLCAAVRRLKDLSLDGLETLHSEHTPEDTGCYTRLAQELDLLVSGGSDYHGANKPRVLLGSQRTALRCAAGAPRAARRWPRLACECWRPTGRPGAASLLRSPDHVSQSRARVQPTRGTLTRPGGVRRLRAQAPARSSPSSPPTPAPTGRRAGPARCTPRVRRPRGVSYR
jgi:predicted metal-dependent phosphoesterase TrpH